MKRMKYKRLELGWNQVTTSFKADVPVSDISKFENGRSLPYPAQRLRLARALHVDPATLLDEVEAPSDLEEKSLKARSRRSARLPRRGGRRAVVGDAA